MHTVADYTFEIVCVCIGCYFADTIAKINLFPTAHVPLNCPNANSVQ